MQLAIADVPGVLGIVAFPDNRGLLGALGKMPIKAIMRDIGLSIFEPFDRDVRRGKRNVLDLCIGLEPIDALPFLAPIFFIMVDRARIGGAIFGVVEPGALGPSGGHVIDFLGHGFLRARLRRAS